MMLLLALAALTSANWERDGPRGGRAGRHDAWALHGQLNLLHRSLPVSMS